MTLKDRIGKAVGAAAEKRKESHKVLTGEYTATVESVKAKTYKSGSFGFEFTYALNDKDVKGRKVFENVVMMKADGSSVKYSEDKLIRRLWACGINDADLATFEIPENSDELGSLPELSGAQVILTLEREIREDNGEPSQRVKKAAPLTKKAA